MMNDSLSHEDAIQLITDKILSGESDQNLIDEGFTEQEIEEAHIYFIAVYL